MPYTYKLLSTNNIDLLKQLFTVFGEAFEDMTAYQSAVPRDSYLRSLLAKKHFIVIVALDGDTVIGGLVAYALEKFEQERTEIYIYDLAVLEAHHRKGIATGLINQLKVVAKDMGAYVIFVQADPGDMPAIKLYESLGTREDVHHFDIAI